MRVQRVQGGAMACRSAGVAAVADWGMAAPPACRNAVPEVKAASNLVVSSNDNGGVAEAIELLIL